MLAFLSDAYSACYGFVNALLIRLEYPAATCAAYLVFELLMPRGRNSARSYIHGAYFVGAASEKLRTGVRVAKLWFMCCGSREWWMRWSRLSISR